MKKLLWALSFCLLFCAGCAETPDGTFVMNEETVENFFEKDKKSWAPGLDLNLLIDQPVAAAQLPGVSPGLERVEGVLTSYGVYRFRGKSAVAERGGTFSKSVFGMLGPAGDGGNAWFYADFNPASGRIENARVYMYGVMGGVCDLRQRLHEAYGKMNGQEFSLAIEGYCQFPQISGSAMRFAALIRGKPVPAAPFAVEYILDDTGAIAAMPADPEEVDAVFDYGSGHAELRPSS